MPGQAQQEYEDAPASRQARLKSERLRTNASQKTKQTGSGLRRVAGRVEAEIHGRAEESQLHD